MTTRSIAHACAAVLLALAAGTAGATGVPQLAAPTVDVNGQAFEGSLDCALTGAQTVCSANNLAGNGFTLDHLSLALNPDPSITSTFTLTNLMAAPQNFTMTVTLPIAPVGAPIAVSGYAGPSTLTDVNGGGATVHDMGSALYSANIDGPTVTTLLDPAWSYSIPVDPLGLPGAPLTIPRLSYGPTTLAQSATSNIQIRWMFNLTGLDQFATTGYFEVVPVPLPGAGALLGGAAGALLAARRRRSRDA